MVIDLHQKRKKKKESKGKREFNTANKIHGSIKLGPSSIRKLEYVSWYKKNKINEGGVYDVIQIVCVLAGKLCKIFFLKREITKKKKSKNQNGYHSVKM